uniref:Enoyl reductase (ER) domain-containing protein n=1 Tax=Globisporangium ultimum (strain ATCC 200006 / CBS 805.95 / DAOM BR144) TaxID=431595 RepID=K3WVD7_GLOUD
MSTTTTTSDHSRIPHTFRAYVHEAFGDARELIKLRTDITHKPLQPGYVRIKVHAAALNPIDCNVIQWGLAFPATTSNPTPENPSRIGFDAAGTIVAAGADVARTSDLQVGDAVFAMAYYGSLGTIAEYVDLDANSVARKPTNLSFNEAAGVPVAALTSFQALVEFGQVKRGDRVLILGGSSATGSFGIQLAKLYGAFVITTTSARNTDLVKAFGADQVIDYTTHTGADVLDATRSTSSTTVASSRRMERRRTDILKPQTGKFLTITAQNEPIESPIGAELIEPRATDLAKLTNRIEANELKTPIDSVHSFENALDGVKIQMSNRARGKIIIEVIPDN